MARILIIDDEAAVRKVLRQMLEKEGHEVAEAEDGNAGVQRYQEHPTDLIITDLLMPGKEGMETIVELRKTWPEVKIIVISGGGRMNQANLLTMARFLGAVKTLGKPFERQELLAVVQEVLAG
jgi:CheY-like chemotaxis protein